MPFSVGSCSSDKGADEDDSKLRASTFRNAHRAFRIFTGRGDPTGRDEQYERLYLALVDASPFQSTVRLTLAGNPAGDVTLDSAIDELLRLVVETATPTSMLCSARTKRSILRQPYHRCRWPG